MKPMAAFAVVASIASTFLLGSNTTADDRGRRFQTSGHLQVESPPDAARDILTEAPTGFDNRTN